MIHSSYLRPRVYPFGNGEPSEIDRLQDMTATYTLNREKIKEIGRDGVVDWRKRIPTLRLTLRQLEYGILEFYNKLGNSNETSIDLNDFKNSMVEICGFATDDAGTFQRTIWYPRLRLAGFGINIGDPQAIIERTFDLVGEDEIGLQNNNKYFIYRTFTATGGSNETFTVSDGTTYPHAVIDPDNSASYMLKVIRVRSGTATELALTTDYSYNAGTYVLTVVTTTAGDFIRVYYSATTAGTQTFFTNNDTDPSGITADSATILLSTGTTVYKLQSVAIDVAFDRTDYYEIGNDEIIQRGVRNKTVTVTLGRILEDYTIEEFLRGYANSANYGKIDPRKFYDNIALNVKLYSDNTKTASVFKMQYNLTDLSPTGLDAGTPLDDYLTRGVSLQGEALTITTNP